VAVSTTAEDRTEALRPSLARRLATTALGLLLIVLGVVYAGTLLETHVGYPGCTREVDDSLSQDGHATMVLLPPRVRCSYPSDQNLGVSAAHDEHFASFWIVILAIFAMFLIPALLLASGWGEDASLSDR
jgi:hypothetical protein